MHTRSGRFVAVLFALCLSLLVTSGLAQDPPPGAQPPPPGGLPPTPAPESVLETIPIPETIDYRDVCLNLADSSVSEGARPLMAGDLTPYGLTGDRRAVGAQIQLPPGASLTMYGPEAWLRVVEGAVAVVSCGGELVFDFIQGDEMQYSVPAGIAAVIDPSHEQGVFLALDEMVDQVWVIQLGHGAVSTIDLDLEVGGSSSLICDQLGCWTTDNIASPPPPGEDAGSTTGGGGCAVVRCWGR